MPLSPTYSVAEVFALIRILNKQDMYVLFEMIEEEQDRYYIIDFACMLKSMRWQLLVLKWQENKTANLRLN